MKLSQKIISVLLAALMLLPMCQRQLEIVRKRRRNFVVFWREVTKIRCSLVQKEGSSAINSILNAKVSREWYHTRRRAKKEEVKRCNIQS